MNSIIWEPNNCPVEFEMGDVYFDITAGVGVDNSSTYFVGTVYEDYSGDDIPLIHFVEKRHCGFRWFENEEDAEEYFYSLDYTIL